MRKGLQFRPLPELATEEEALEEGACLICDTGMETGSENQLPNPGSHRHAEGSGEGDPSAQPPSTFAKGEATEEIEALAADQSDGPSQTDQNNRVIYRRG